MKNYNISITGLIVPIDAVYKGDCVNGDRSLTQSEIMLYERGFGCEIIEHRLVDISETAEYKAKELQKARALKLQENEQKRNVEYINTSLGLLKTQTPIGDLKTALPLYREAALKNGGLPQGAVRLYDAEGNVTLSPAITLEEFEALSMEIVMAYLAIDSKSTQYTTRVNAAKTIEELETVVIDYAVQLEQE